MQNASNVKYTKAEARFLPCKYFSSVFKRVGISQQTVESRVRHPFLKKRNAIYVPQSAT